MAEIMARLSRRYPCKRLTSWQNYIIISCIIIKNDNGTRIKNETVMEKVDLIMHPLRLRIMQALSRENLTTQAIAELLPDAAVSSIYRHLKLLLEGGMIEVAETELVQGIQQKTYRLAQSPHLGPEDVAGLNAETHVHYFATYLMSLLRDFANYLQAAEAEAGALDLLADQTGYTETIVYATPEEMETFRAEFLAALAKLVGNEGGNGRSRRKLALISHPLK
jgi:DNA-binding transcriptional ArsR family regulator